MILPSAVSDWPCLVPGRRGIAPGPLLSMAVAAMRRARPRSQRLINHNCFNSINDVFRARSEPSLKYREFVGVFLIVMAGPARGRSRRATPFRAALPCLALIALSGLRRRRRPSRPTCSARRARARSTHAGFAAAPDHGGRQRQDRDAANSAAAARQRHRHAGAVADRADPALRPAGRERRLGLRLRLAQPQAQEAEILSGAGQAEAAGRSRQSAAADCVEHAAAAFDPAVGDPPTRRRSRRRWPAPWSASRRASGSGSTTIRSARSAIMPAAS